MLQTDVWCQQPRLARCTKRHNRNYLHHRVWVQYLIYLCCVRGRSPRHDHRVNLNSIAPKDRDVSVLTSIVMQWPLRRESKQDLDSSSCTSQQRHLRARAHFVCLHCKHIPSALRHGIVRLRRYLPLPLVCARHHSVRGGAQWNDLCFGRPHIRNFQLSRTRKPTCNDVRSDQEYLVVRDQFWYHAVAAV
jgi:hypothetical protein